MTKTIRRREFIAGLGVELAPGFSPHRGAPPDGPIVIRAGR